MDVVRGPRRAGRIEPLVLRFFLLLSRRVVARWPVKCKRQILTAAKGMARIVVASLVEWSDTVSQAP